jgi:thioredoxin-like negative regulator of GroEL
VALAVGARAIAFHDEWSPDEEAVTDLLTRLAAIDASADWVLSRLSLAYATAQRWDELLALYDRALAAIPPGDRRTGLLAEAARVAKDCAGQIDRAVGYLEQLFAARPADAQAAATLERLLKQQKRFRELVDLWTARLARIPEAEVPELRVRIATTWLSSLSDPAAALAAVEPLFERDGGASHALPVVAGVVAAPGADPELRARAFARLREHSGPDGAGLLIDALSAMIAFADDATKPALHAELAAKLIARGDAEGWGEHVVALLVIDPAGFPAPVVARLVAGESISVGSASLPGSIEVGRRLVHEAARRAAADPRTEARAIELYRALLAVETDDAVALDALASLLSGLGHRAELLDLRRHQLRLAASDDARLALRLEMAGLAEQLGDASAAAASLRENLAERRGHGPSVDALATLLRAAGEHEALAKALEAEATALEASDGPAAASLWARAADVAESPLGDVSRAVRWLERSAALEESASVLDALARLEGVRGDLPRVSRWLERRVAVAKADERTEVVLRLAEACIAERRFGRARELLDAEHQAHPERSDVLSLLVRVLRDTDAHEDLASALVRGAEHASVPADRVRLRVEAAAILGERLGDPRRAADVLAPALALAPEDGVLRAAMADAYRRAGRFAEARDLLVETVASYGRRRPRERAEAHFQLACALEALGDQPSAAAELELAVSIDPEHVRAQKLVGDLAFAEGRAERADRAYTAVMMIVARNQGGGAALVDALFDLHRVAKRRGLSRAEENLASAFEVAAESPQGARRLEERLADSGEHEALASALATRLSRAASPDERGDVQGRLAAAREAAGDASGAFAGWLDTLSSLPLDTRAHERAVALAAALGRGREYEAHLERLAATARESASAATLSPLLVRLAEAREGRGALDEAASLLARAEDTGEGLPAVWRAIARVARARGDGQAALVALRKLEGGDLPRDERAELRLQVATLELDLEPAAAIDTLERALSDGLDPARARLVLRRAAEVPGIAARACDLLVTACRGAGDDAALLEALSLRASVPDESLDVLREAASLAVRLADPRADGLLDRVACAGGDPDVATWALSTLAERALVRGESAVAVSFLTRAAALAPPDASRRLARAAADLLAGVVEDPSAAVDAYQALFDEDPGDVTVWAPLIDTARRVGDPVRLDRALAGMIDSTFDVRERGALRMERAHLLVAEGRADEARDVLGGVLFDDPDHPAAAALLAALLAQAGRTDELADLLARQVELARERHDLASVAELSLRLAGALRESRPDDAIVALRDAAASVPNDRRILRLWLELLPERDPDRPDVMETLLAAEDAARSPAEGRVLLAMGLADARLASGNAEGAERALLRALTLAPHERGPRERLTALVDDLVAAARGAGRGSLAIEGVGATLRRAARILRSLGDLPRVAAVLGDARALDPNDRFAAVELARVLVDLGDLEEALEALDGIPEPDGPTLRLRAEVLVELGRNAEAAEALTIALAAGDTSADEPLLAALRAAYGDARGAGDAPLARALYARLAARLAARADVDGAINLLEGARSIVDDEPFVEAALALEALAVREERTDAARRVLESALEARPTDGRVRARLRVLYQADGAHRELCALLVLEARHTDDPAARFDSLREVGRLRLDVLGEANGAIGPLSDARALRPGDAEVTLLLVDALSRASLHDDAAQVLRDAIKQQGGKRSRALAVLQKRMAELSLSQGDRASELAWLLAAFESHPQSPEIAKALADVAVARGDDEAAGRAYRAITLMRTDLPMSRADAYAGLAGIADRQGDPRKAATLARKALSEDASNVAAQDVLARVTG